MRLDGYQPFLSNTKESKMDLISQTELFRRQYLQLQDPSRLVLPLPEELKKPKTQAFFFDSMFRDGCLNFPPPDHYKIRVLKRLVGAIEEAIEDSEEDVWISLMRGW